MLQILFYFAFTLRRLFRADVNGDQSRIYSAYLLLVFIEARLVMLLIDLCFPNLMKNGSPLAWGLLICAPVAIPTYLQLEKASLYESYAKRFRLWSTGKRVIADVVVAAISILVLVSPVMIRSMQTGRPWWD
jgi:hypothetical protein